MVKTNSQTTYQFLPTVSFHFQRTHFRLPPARPTPSFGTRRMRQGIIHRKLFSGMHQLMFRVCLVKFMVFVLKFREFQKIEEIWTQWKLFFHLPIPSLETDTLCLLNQFFCDGCRPDL